MEALRGTPVVAPRPRIRSTTLLDSYTTPAVVVKIVDGDTIHATVGGVVEKIRISGIDAPERAQEYGVESKRTLEELMPVGTPVTLQLQGSVNSPKRGHYGRLLATIFLSVEPSLVEDSISLMMVKRGAAWHYKAFNSDIALSAAEEQARKDKVGLWASGTAIQPSSYRKQKKTIGAVNKRISTMELSKRRKKPTPTASIL